MGGRRCWACIGRAWDSVGRTPERWIGDIGIVVPQRIWHSTLALRPVEPILGNFIRTVPTGPSTFQVAGTSTPGSDILVANRAIKYVPLDVLEARADAGPMREVYSDFHSRVFRIDGAAGNDPIHWTIELRSNPDFIDVLTF